jgi:hypothetical protein
MGFGPIRTLPRLSAARAAVSSTVLQLANLPDYSATKYELSEFDGQRPLEQRDHKKWRHLM